MPSAIRSAMEPLIARVRGMIGDTASEDSVFSDDEVQDALDRTAEFANYVELSARYTLTPVTGAVAYKDFYATDDFGSRIGDWETAELVNYQYSPLTPATSDLLTGHWTFSTGQNLPVLLVGTTYDLNAAAGDLLTQWAAKEAPNYDTAFNLTQRKESQKSDRLGEMAQMYLAKRRTSGLTMGRSDLNQNDGMGK